MNFAESLQPIQKEIDNNVYSKEKDSHETTNNCEPHNELNSNQLRVEETPRNDEIPKCGEMSRLHQM